MAATLDERLLKLPVVYDWYNYMGELYFVAINYQASEKANRAMMDLHYCATKCMNNIVLKTVRFDKNKFSPRCNTETIK